MTDRELIMEIFKRLNSNFFYKNNNMVAETDSEVAADSLMETLFNIDLENLYVRTNEVDENGHWFARFTVKPE